MHIAILTDGITPYVTGGMQRHSHHLVRHLLKLGTEITLVHCVSDDDAVPEADAVRRLLGAPEDKLRVLGFKFPKAGRLPGHYLRESYRYSCTVYEALKEEWVKFDFIYAKGYTAWCLLEQKQKGEHTAPVGIKFHGYEMFQKTGDLKDKLIQFMLRPPVVFMNRNANVVFSYGGEISRIITQMGTDPNHVIDIPSGIDDDWIAEAPLPSGGKRNFLFIGRNEKRKGIDDLLRCKKVIAESGAGFHWVGPIPDDKQLDCPNCTYHGEVKNSEKLKAIIDGCQVLVVPSHSEGMPNVILEGMARGLAVIATQVGAVPALVDETCGMVPKPMKIGQLRSAIRRMAEMPEEELDRLRNNALDRVSKNFRWSDVASLTLKAIEKATHLNGYRDSDAEDRTAL